MRFQLIADLVMPQSWTKIPMCQSVENEKLGLTNLGDSFSLAFRSTEQIT